MGVLSRSGMFDMATIFVFLATDTSKVALENGASKQGKTRLALFCPKFAAIAQLDAQKEFIKVESSILGHSLVSVVFRFVEARIIV